VHFSARRKCYFSFCPTRPHKKCTQQDGAAGRTESVLGIWMVNMLTQRRHYIMGVKSLDCCQCGCRGWCTMQPALAAVEHQMYHLQCGRVPDTTYNGSPLPNNLRYPPGTETPTAIMLFVKGDWAEHAHTLALSPHSVFWQPCQFCCLCKDELHSHNREISSGMNWPLRTHADYFASCRKCEQVVTIRHQRDLAALLPNLKWGAHKKGAGGRLIWKDCVVNGVALQVGDRLEPNENLIDISLLSSVQCPCKIVFWRVRFEDKDRPMDSVSHRCPLFSERIHASPASTLAIDAMHTLMIGPVMRYVAAALWRIVLRNPYNMNRTLEAMIGATVQVVRADLLAWMADKANGIPINRQVKGLTVKMLGRRLKRNTQDGLCFLFSLLSFLFSLLYI
jgi:hypothetical protein